ncbi:MAG: hypothetical protein AB7P01_13700 [Bacteroidia bacterium]
MDDNLHNRELYILAVSPHLKSLRDNQHFLNQVLWSTEVSYGYFLEYFKPTEAQTEMRVFDVLGELPIEAWFLNNRGYIKYPASVKRHIQNVKENMSNICK